MKIIEINQVTDELAEAMARLIPQLAPHPIPNREALHRVVSSPNILLIAAHEDSCIVGTLTLILFQTPTALKAQIEDVIVDKHLRNKGIGEAMVLYALEIAAPKKAIHVDLTSNPERKAANRLYERLGFNKYNTNVYRYLYR